MREWRTASDGTAAHRRGDYAVSVAERLTSGALNRVSAPIPKSLVLPAQRYSFRIATTPLDRSALPENRCQKSPHSAINKSCPSTDFSERRTVLSSYFQSRVLIFSLEFLFSVSAQGKERELTSDSA